MERVDPALIEAAHEVLARGLEVVYFELPFAETVLPDGSRLPESGDFLFRTLSYREFDAFSRTAHLGDITDLLVRDLIVYPRTERWDDNPINLVDAGSFEGVSTMLASMSGFDDKKALYQSMKDGRVLASTPFSAAQMFIARAFPGVTPTQVTEMTALEMFRLVGMAEHLLGQDGKPTRFPIGELMGDGQQKQSKAPIPEHMWNKLPELTPMQVERMKQGDRRQMIKEKIREKKILAANPEARAERSLAVRERQMERIMHQRQGADEESAKLRLESGGF